jgi:GNAT superfamily N-acetyltransferase
MLEPGDCPSGRGLIDCLEDGIANGRNNAGILTDRRDDYPTIRDLTRVLVGVGLGSVPVWLKPYAVLSAGERFRADLARGIVRAMGRWAAGGNRRSEGGRPPLLVVDEFTSALDRPLAKNVCAAVGRLLRCNGGQARGLRYARLVAVTCHEDIVPWLAPDWVVDLGRSDGDGGSRALWSAAPRTPSLELSIARVPQALWQRFAKHHYLAGGLAASATCYGAFLAESPVAFCAVVAALGWKKTKRITRLVTLPEYQGLGIAGRLLDGVAAVEASRGQRVTITASHPAIVAHCAHSPGWRYTGMKKTGSTRQRMGGRTIRSSAGRAVAAFGWEGGRAEG